MSKRAEEAALKAYPGSTRDEFGILTFWGYAKRYRECFIEGYEQAERDLALTWEDMKLIDELITEMAFSEPNDSTEWYQELANRFNEQRNK